VHSAWLSVGEISARLVRAGVMRAQGFFVNLSNYRFTEQVAKYGTWISKCIAFANNAEEGGWRLGHYDWCASQYFSPLGPVNPNDISTWVYTDHWFDQNLGTAQPTAHFVTDTSRNGRGPTPDAAWCNPDGRGLGHPSTGNTGDPAIDAFLWVKVPGESDGTCNGGPPAGTWWPEYALGLAQRAAF
jgi:endoglucanase